MDPSISTPDPLGHASRARLPAAPVSEGYLQLLQTRPWESALARSRLQVPGKLLPPHCPVLTNWVVITGGTCAGKSTLIDALAKLGFPVVREIARGYVEREVQNGRTVAELRQNDRFYRQHVFELTLQEELRLLTSRAHELLFLDRSPVDSVSFHRGSGYDPHEIVSQLENYRYAHVFVCNLLPFADDGLRTANEERRHFLDAAFERDYRALGYRPVRVPVATVDERVRCVLQYLADASRG